MVIVHLGFLGRVFGSRAFGSNGLACYCLPCRANAQQPKLFVGMILILIFAEALALYGLIGKKLTEACLKYTYMRPMLKADTHHAAMHAVGIILASKAGQSGATTPAV